MKYRGADTSLARPGRKQANVSVVKCRGADKSLVRTGRKQANVSVVKCRGADKSLVRTGRKQANVSVRMAWNSFGTLPCKKEKHDDSSRLDVVEIALFLDVLPSLFHSWSG